MVNIILPFRIITLKIGTLSSILNEVASHFNTSKEEIINTISQIIEFRTPTPLR